MRLHLVANNATSHVLLTRNGRAVSAWQVTPDVMADLLRDGRAAEDWDEQDRDGLRTPDGTRYLTVEDYGEPILAVDRRGWQVVAAPTRAEAVIRRHLEIADDDGWTLDGAIEASDRRAAAATLGRRGGSARSAAKRAAARANGRRGGRPRRRDLSD